MTDCELATTVGTSVVIFDCPGPDPSGFGLRVRVAACYRLANSRGWIVEKPCQAVGQEDTGAEIERAPAICDHARAALMVYEGPVAEISGQPPAYNSDYSHWMAIRAYGLTRGGVAYDLPVTPREPSRCPVDGRHCMDSV